MADQKHKESEFEESDPIADVIREKSREQERLLAEGLPDPLNDEEGGYTGGEEVRELKDTGDIVPGPSDLTTPVAAKPDYKKFGKYANYGAYDQEKAQRPWEDMSEKYKIGAVLSNFDPTKGLTPEVIEALNSANIFGAKFGMDGEDKLNVIDTGGHERFGSGGIGDVIEGFKTGNGKWGAWADPNLQPEVQAEMPGQGGGGGIAPPSGALNAMIANGLPDDYGFFEQLMKQAQQAAGGQVDRRALLSLMGA